VTPLQPSISADLIPGEYRVRIADPAAGTFLRGIGTPSADLRVEPLILDPSRESVEILGITGESEGIVLEGRLVSTDPEWSAEHIVISAAAIDRTVEVAVGADGSFRIPAMMPGAWWMRVPLTPQIGIGTDSDPGAREQRQRSGDRCPGPRIRDWSFAGRARTIGCAATYAH